MRISTISSFFAASLILASACCFSAVPATSALTFQVVEAQMIFNRSNIESATVVKQGDKSYGLEIKLTPPAAHEFAQISNAGIGKTMNMVFKGKIISASTIQSALGDNFLVTGLSKNEAEEIVRNASK